MRCARKYCRAVGTEMVDGFEFCPPHAQETRDKRPRIVVNSPEDISKAPMFMIEVNADNDPVGLYDSVSGRRWKLEEEL